MRWNGLILSMLCSICVVFIVHAYEKFPPEKDLVDQSYYEGIREHINVSAGQVKLKSFTARYAKDQADDDDPNFNIDFYVSREFLDKDIDIFVEDRGTKAYYMIPVRKQWEEGFQTFRWSRRKAQKYGIALPDLFGLAKVGASDFAQTIIPLTFYHADKPAQIENYEFVFVASRTANLKYMIVDESEQEAVFRSLKNQPRNKNITVRWNCKNAAPGKYILFVEYLLKNGKIVQGSDTYEFYHK